MLVLLFGAYLIFGRRKPTVSNQTPATTAQSAAKIEAQAKAAEFKSIVQKTLSDDSDGDGLSNEREKTLGTDPNNPDTDHDGLLDGAEVDTYHTNPLKADTDGDGYSDGQEVWHGTNPLDPKSHP